MKNSSEIIIYCAGPSSFPEERKLMLEIGKVLENAGCITYLPFRDGLEQRLYSKNSDDISSDNIDELEKAAFALELFQITERCDSLVLNLNGRVPDEGALFCASLAFTYGKPLVLFKKDHRSTFYGEDNSMITGLSDFNKVNKIDKIPVVLNKVIKKNQSIKKNVKTILAFDIIRKEEIKRGRIIWSMLNKDKPVNDKNFTVSDILSLCRSSLEG